MDVSEQLHVAIVSSPGMGHLVPVLLLGKRLATHHNVRVTILVVTANTSAAESQHLHSSAGSDLIDIVPVDISNHVFDQNANMVTLLCVMMRTAVPAIRSAISSMRPKPDVLVVDLFSTESFPVAIEFGMPKYVYIPSTAWFTALSAYCQVLDKQIQGQFVDQTEPLIIPGCKPVRPEDVVDPMLDRNQPQYKEYVRQGIGFTMGDGILLNSWEELERESLKALREDESLRSIVKSPIYTIGPLSRPVEPGGANPEFIGWLDMQPSESVLYVSFGSGGTMSAEQMIELAWGLELSQQRFIWVVRPPAKNGADGTFFTSGNGSDCMADYLPNGFLKRTQEVGLVVPLWAPQVEILSHPSIGGFLSHCGWNSTLESIGGGVPMIAWPLYAEQRLNATLLTEELKVAVRPEILPTKRVVGREEIQKMVRTTMQNSEGKAMRDRVKELKKSAERALSKSGSSYISICGVLKDCQTRIQSYKTNGSAT